jgi:two-component system, sensor histidine kinase PdtaS
MEKLLEFIPGPRLPLPVRYGLTVVIILVCDLLQVGLQAHSRFPGFFLMLPGIFFCGLLFNRGSGFLAALLSLLFSMFAVSFNPSDDLLPFTLFGVTAAGTAFVAEILRKVMVRLVESERSKTLLLQELAHRTKNNLAILSALVRLQAKDKDPGVAEALENTSHRITVLAEVYDHLMLRDDTKVVDAREYLAQVFEKIRSILDPAMPIAITTESDEYYMPSTQAVPLAIIANELVTNAYKYAFSDGRPGHIHVALKVQDAIELSVSDNGIGLKNAETPGGFGSRIIALLTQQLGGSLHYERLEAGCRVVLRIPLAAPESPPAAAPVRV